MARRSRAGETWSWALLACVLLLPADLVWSGSIPPVENIPQEKVVAAHGNFDGARCLNGHAADVDEVEKACRAGGTPLRCATCDEYIKPDIVFKHWALSASFRWSVALGVTFWYITLPVLCVNIMDIPFTI